MEEKRTIDITLKIIQIYLVDCLGIDYRTDDRRTNKMDTIDPLIRIEILFQLRKNDYQLEHSLSIDNSSRLILQDIYRTKKSSTVQLTFNP